MCQMGLLGPANSRIASVSFETVGRRSFGGRDKSAEAECRCDNLQITFEQGRAVLLHSPTLIAEAQSTRKRKVCFHFHFSRHVTLPSLWSSLLSSSWRSCRVQHETNPYPYPIKCWSPGVAGPRRWHAPLFMISRG